MQRQLALDGARGFSVLFIPATHCFLAYGQPQTHHSWVACILRAIAEGPGVHVFLFIMGIAFTLKQQHAHISAIKRAILLLLAGYALNALKFVIPYLFGRMPLTLQHDLQLSPGQEIMQLLLMGDIFHSAGIMLIIIHAVYRVRNYWFWSVVLAIACVIISPVLPAQENNYTIQLFTGAPPRVFYPLLFWLPYPLLGLTIGYGLRRRKQVTIKWLGIVGLILTASCVTIVILTGQFAKEGYYRPLAIESFAHIGIVFCYIWVWYKITPHITNKPIFELFQFSSEHITRFYAVQWIFICWLIPFTGYQTMNLLQTIMMAMYVTAISFAITYFITHYKTIFK